MTTTSINHRAHGESARSRSGLVAGLALLGLAGALLATALGGCTSSRGYPAKHTLIKVWYSTGGASPVVTELTVTNDRYLGLLTTHWTHHTLQVHDEELARLRRLLDSTDLRAALAGAGPRGARHPTSEERVLLTLGDHEHLFRVGALPAAIRTLLEAVDDLYTRSYGPRYSLRIPH